VAANLVLVADDDAAVRKLLRRLLIEEFEIVEAADGEEAVNVALAQRPGVILLDLQMPRLDGYGALLRMRSEGALCTTPILVVTGAATSGEDAAMCLRDGAHDFVRKPFEETELLARVRAASRHKAFEDELRRRNRELEAFASAAAHDLKEPLVGIARIVELLQGMHMSETSRLRMQDDIGLLAGQGSRLVADLLALAREDWATAALLHQVLDVEQVVRTVLDEARLVDAKVSVEGSWAKLVVPEVVMQSLVANLVSNANHYGRDAEGRLDLTVEGAVGPGTFRMVVADSGPGVHASVIDRIFEPFATAPDSAEQNPLSSGLGLAVAARIVERYGGRLELLRDRPTGTAFQVTLPLPDL
jgi:signal transduction histidine kinase